MKKKDKPINYEFTATHQMPRILREARYFSVELLYSSGMKITHDF